MCPIDASEPANGHSVADAHTSPPNAPDATLPLTLPRVPVSSRLPSSSSSRCSSSLPVSPSLTVCRRRLRAVLAVSAVAATALAAVVSVEDVLAAAAVCGCARRDREEFVSLPMF